ncbi:MAG: hypothetical protein IJX57_05965 [Clostridia bacterium]|nr:hypothetical protein [Clostridia bacterium]
MKMSISFSGAKKYKKHNGLSSLSIIKKPLAAPVYYYRLKCGDIMLNPLVKTDDYVFKGEKIADLDIFDAVPVHSGVSGKVLAVYEDMIAIENDDIYRTCAPMDFGKEFEALTSRELLWIMRENGVCETRTGTPMHVLLGRQKTPSCIIVCCFDSDPYVSSPQVCAMNNAEKILSSLDIIFKILGIKKAIIATEGTVGNIYSDFKYLLRFNEDISLYSLKPRYPQSDNDILIKTVTGHENEKANALVLSAETLLNMWEVFERKMPVTDKVVTVSGDDILPPDNFRVPLGTPVSALLTSSGYLEPEIIINGGVIDGEIIIDNETPVTRTTKAILAFNDKKNIPRYRKEPI